MAEEETPNSWTADIFRPFVDSTLDEWKRDTLFMDIGLGASDTILKEGEGIPGKDEKTHPYNKIFSLIAKKISDKFNLDKQSKKTMIIMLRSFNIEWEAMVRAMQMQSPPKKSQVSSSLEESAVDNGHQSEEPEVKTESADIVIEKERIEPPDQAIGEIDVDLSAKQLKMKEEFEKTKKEVLDSLPDEVKSKFGQQYFSKWAKSHLPCLVLSPYSVPPGSVRDMWFDMYEKVKNQGRLSSASNLVYWYGASNDPANAYSFVVSSKLTPYATGEKKNMHVLPNPVQKKVEANKKLSPADQMLVDGLEEMKEDMEKEPEDRHGRMVQAFLEEWENDAEKEELTKKESVKEIPKPKAKTKGKKLTKRKSLDKSVDEAEPKPKKQKKSMKTEEPKVVVDETKPAESKAPGPPKKDETADETPATVAKVEDIRDIGDDDISSHEDKDDLEDVEPLTESDEDDEDFEYDKKVKKPKTLKKTAATPKAAPKKKAQKTKNKLEKPRSDKKKVPEGERKRMMEQAKFRECEIKYLKIIDDWKYGLDNYSKGTIKEIYVRLLDCVAKFSAPFIEAYEMPALMKQSKRIADDENRLKLWKTMKDVYQKKKNEVPPGFVPQKTDRSAEVPKMEADEKPNKVASVENLEDSDKLPTKIPTKTKVEIQEPPSTPTKSASAASAPEKKKKFSLGSIMTKPKSASKPVASTSSSSGDLSRSSSSSQLSKRQKNPQWISETSIKDTLKDENRSFALEFLQQATPLIPPNDKVNPDAIARELEASIFEWAGGREDVGVSDCFVKYWDKVDDVVAAISGDNGNGTIARMISQGRFQSASDVVGLSENDIACSYEGRPLEDFKFD